MSRATSSVQPSQHLQRSSHEPPPLPGVWLCGPPPPFPHLSLDQLGPAGSWAAGPGGGRGKCSHPWEERGKQLEEGPQDETPV